MDEEQHPENVFDPANFIFQERRNAQVSVLQDIDGDPEKAARALQLSKVTGTGPNLIYSDLENFETQTKATLASNLLRNNEYLRGFVNTHPLASKLASDDWGNLDKASQSMSKFDEAWKQRSEKGLSAFGGSISDAAIKGISEGFVQGFGDGGIGQWAVQNEKDQEFVKEHPLAAATATGLAAPAELVLRTLSGGIKAFIEGSAKGVEETYKQLGASESTAASAGKAAGGIAEMLTTQPQVHMTPGKAPGIDTAKLLKAQEGLAAAEPWLKEGREPPLGVHPVIDEIKIKQSDIDLENLDEAQKDAQASSMRERSPEAYAEFARGQLKGKEISISAEAVRKLYGDKEPVWLDGKLGFVPRLGDQLTLAELSGGDVSVPLADWLAHVDPKVAKELRDDIRVRSGGVTKNEAQVLKAQELPEETKPQDTTQVVRASDGLNPIGEGLALEKEDLGAGVVAHTKPTEAYTAHEKVIVEQVQKVLSRIAPELTDVRTVSDVKMRGTEVGGVYIAAKDTIPLIAVSLNARDAGKTARHEAIHFLRDYGFFEAEEWQALEKEALNSWIKKHNIRERYKKHGEYNDLDLAEEAIAEEFGEWGSTTEPARKHLNDAVEKAFYKLAQFFKEILDAMKELFGHTPKIDELFEKIESGEVGRRAQEGQREQVDTTKAQQGELDVTRLEDKAAFERAKAIGMTEANLARYMKAIERKRNADREAQERKLVEAERKKQSQLWKDNERSVREEVVDDFKTRPDIQADDYFRTGNLYGEFGAKPKIDKAALSAEQRKALPESYVADKGGMLPDDLAPLFGYTSGEEFVSSLSAFVQARKDSGMQPMVFQRRLVQVEIDKRMEQRYGSLTENTLEAIKDQIHDETQLDIMHEETVGLAMKAGAELPIPKDLIKQGVKDQIEGFPLSSIKSSSFEAATAKGWRAVEEGLLKDKPSEALKAQQQRYMSEVAAQEARLVEKQVAQFEKKIRPYRGRDLPKAVDPEYGVWVQKLLHDAEVYNKLTPEEIQAGLAFHGHATLDDFAAHVSSYGQEVDVPQGYAPKAFEDMTVGEFREFKDTVNALDKAGRDNLKIVRAGETVDRADFRAEVIANLKERPRREMKSFDPKDWSWLYSLDAIWTKPEDIIKSLDFRKEMGPLFESMVVPYERSKAKAFDMLSKLSDDLKKIKGFDPTWSKTFGEELPGDFVFDTATQTPMKLTRWNMIKMMMNMGNESNAKQLHWGIAASHLNGEKPTGEQVQIVRERVERFVHQHASAEDWKFVQHVWDIFDGWRKESDTLYRNLTGNAPKWIAATLIDTSHGQFAGGYMPLIPDKMRVVGTGIKEAGGAPVGKGPLGPDFYRATIHTPFLKERVGGDYFVDITNGPENLAGRMQQTIHDIAFRDFVVNASKIVYDKQIMNAVRQHYGPEYASQMDSWLRRIANQYTASEKDLQKINVVLKTFRMNLIAHALPLNPAVNLSPSVGALNLKLMSNYLSDRKANRDLVMEHSNEVRHLAYNLDRDVSEQIRTVMDKSTLSGYQKRAVEFLLTPLMKAEKGLRSVTFYGEFMEQKAKGLTDKQAADLADSVVRERHGSMAPGDLPAALATKNEFVKIATVFLGYFNTMYNWSRQIPDHVRLGNHAEVGKILWGTLGIMAVSNAALFQRRKKDDTLFSYLSRAVASAPLAGIPYVREAYNYVAEGFRPNSPIFGFFTALAKVGKDGYDWAKGKKVKNPVKDTANLLGTGLGIPGAMQAGRWGELAHKLETGEEKPKDIVEWGRAIMTGESKLRK